MADPTLRAGEARTTVRAMLITPQEGEPFLLVEVEIRCADCGDLLFTIGGHHVDTLVASLQKVQEDYPGVTGGLEVVDRRKTHWSAPAPPPDKARMN